MSTSPNSTAKYQLAKSFTELAIQNNLINKCKDSESTAKEVARFFDAIFDNVGKSEVND